MRLRRMTCLLGLVCLLLAALCIVVRPAEVRAEGGNQSITTTVPCTVVLHVGDHGSVTVDGEAYKGSTSMTALLGTRLTYKVTPDEGFTASVVVYNGVDVTDALRGGSYVAAPLEGDATFFVDFDKRPTREDASQIDSAMHTEAQTVATGRSVGGGSVTSPSLGNVGAKLDVEPVTTARTSDASISCIVGGLACLVGMACIIVAVAGRTSVMD